MSQRSKTPNPAFRVPGHEGLIESLIQDLGQLFDLETPIGERTVGEAMEDRLRSLRADEPPAWGGEGDFAQVAKVETGPLDFYYRPHLFPDMDPALRLGHQLQFDLLPRRLPSRSPLRIAALLESYCHLSGDLLGWHLEEGREDEELFLWIADVSGHGVRAGLAAAVLYFLVDAIGPNREPATFARLMNDSILEARNQTDPRALFATAFWLRFCADGRAAYASCGHPPMLLRRAGGGIEELPATGLPLALMPDQTFDQVEFRLEPGDSLVLFTDGLLEAPDPEEEEFGYERLLEVVRQQTSTVGETARAIYRAVGGHKVTKFLDDDLTFMVVEPAAGNTVLG